MDGFEYFENPSEAYLQLKGRYSHIEGFRVLDNSELPPHVKFGVTYKTFSLNSPVYLAWLERQLILGGIQFVKYDLVNLLEACAVLKDIDARIILNCSGIGFSDPDVFPTRGKFSRSHKFQTLIILKDRQFSLRIHVTEPLLNKMLMEHGHSSFRVLSTVSRSLAAPKSPTIGIHMSRLQHVKTSSFTQPKCILPSLLMDVPPIVEALKYWQTLLGDVLVVEGGSGLSEKNVAKK